MSTQSNFWFRLGVLSDLVARSPVKPGRTALMKLAYLLQTVKGVPLGYHYRLYTYGPYDADVLDDLGQAETMRAVQSSMVAYGYEFSEGPEYARIRRFAETELARYQDSIQWVLDQFGNRTAADLELLSTIIYADQNHRDRNKVVPIEELARQVREIKPRFSPDSIKQNIESLRNVGLLHSLST